MRKRELPILGPSYADPNLHWTRQASINWLLVRDEAGGALTQWQLRDAPGVKPFVRITRTVETDDGPVVIDVGPGRGLRNVEGKLFVVAAQQLYQISNNGVAIPFGTIPGVGRVSMAHNQRGLGNELLTVNGSAGYVFNTNTSALVKITDEGYPGAFIADYVDQYLVQIEPQGRYWFHSDLADATQYNTLDRYEAEADPDRMVSLLVSHREVLVFGKDTIEPFVNTGGQTGTFERASNTVIEVGCAAKFTPRRRENSVCWLDDKRIVRRMDGYTPVRISTDAIEAAFQECSEAEILQAYAFVWESRGHKVYYITVPGRFTFGHDELTGQWHQRSTWGMKHWDVIDVAFWNGKWIALSGQSGRIYELDWDYKLDRCDPLLRQRTTGKLWDAENEMSLNNVELKFQTGGPVSVCVPFPAQPTGPSISGEAPDAPGGTPYSYSYTATPGDAPIDRIILMPGSYIVIGGEQKPIPNDGWSWDQGTATIENSVPPLSSVVLRMRVYDTNGLFADHMDAFDILEAYEMLVTGRQIAPGGFNFAGFINVDAEDVTGIPQVSGADLQDTVCGYDGTEWCAVTSGGSRFATAIAGPWTSGGAPGTSLAEVFPGVGGWFATTPPGSSSQLYEETANNFTLLPRTATDPARQARLADGARRIKREGDYYYTFSDYYIFRCEDPRTDTWDTFYENEAGQTCRLASDMIEHDGKFYACGITRSTSTYFIGWSDDGTDWPTANNLFTTPRAVSPPVRLYSFPSGLIAYCSGGRLRASSNGWAEIDIGIAGVSSGLEEPTRTNVSGRVLSAGGLLYILGAGDDSNKMVVFNPETLQASAPIILPLRLAVGLASRKL